MPNKRVYEILYIINPTLTEEEIDQVHTLIQETINSSEGVVRREDKWGKRHLAYEVQKFREGFYALIEFDGTGETVKALKDLFRVESRVIRQLITAVPKARFEEEKRKAKVAAKRADEAKKKAEAEAARQQAEAEAAAAKAEADRQQAEAEAAEAAAATETEAAAGAEAVLPPAAEAPSDKQNETPSN